MNPRPSFGALASPIDLRDHSDSSLTVAEVADKHITDISNLRVRMQHKIGKCTGEAVGKKTEEMFKIDTSDDFLYRGTKDKIDGNLIEGSSIRSVLKFAQEYGVCTRSKFEVPVTKFMSYQEYLMYSIPDAAYEEAKKYKIGRYYAVPTDPAILKAAIRKYGTVLVRMEVGEEWYTPSWKASDIMPLKAPKNPISGHAVVLYGYDSTLVPGKTAFYIANSWSSDWGDKGNGYFFYEDYKPTEAWAVTSESVPKDGSPKLTEATVADFIKILKQVGVIK